jgi:hypothetical protein
MRKTHQKPPTDSFEEPKKEINSWRREGPGAFKKPSEKMTAIFREKKTGTPFCWVFSRSFHRFASDFRGRRRGPKNRAFSLHE